MAVKARMKFRSDIPWKLEHKMITKWGFTILSRNKDANELVVQKVQKSNWQPEVLENGELPMDVQAELIKRCNNIVNMFSEPEQHLTVIRIRLHNISLTLPPLQQQFVKDWSDRNCGEDQ